VAIDNVSSTVGIYAFAGAVSHHGQVAAGVLLNLRGPLIKQSRTCNQKCSFGSRVGFGRPSVDDICCVVLVTVHYELCRHSPSIIKVFPRPI
jgi:hypothetical protein